MKTVQQILFLVLLGFALCSAEDEDRKGMKGSKKSGMATRVRTMTLRVTNLMDNQPLSGFFVMVHDYRAKLFQFGYPSSVELADLAENGNPMPLVRKFEDMEGVLSAEVFSEGAPYFGGAVFDIDVTMSRRYPLITIASMAINTNDMFIAVNGMRLYPGETVYLNGLDAGSEVNNELCSSIPGPGCAMINTTNVASGDGEGYVFVHKGFHGVGDLPAAEYDWRNPAAVVEALY
eukprot:CAMPEP_0116575690 /NCGR_PEP_ID=MMETSP0397-20121206/20095_1 /TAXON_ID=216820 /ORGANISM="Cyclophora tenuis, Strain ECT3854" /LENGTH=232 /DNA_ID=CAMNT_0004104605 /DNA_START=68 /DNA_END=766 /DNA_ORIENTATION=+